MKRPETVWVRNNGTEDYTDKYDGEEFVIPAGGAVEMLIETATLCLGFGEEDKSRAARRNGWATTSDKVKDAEKRFAAFSFHMTEREASHPSKESRSSAPSGGETPAAASDDSRRRESSKNQSPLEKLAAASAAG